jgi:hypothetical protein
MKFYHVTDQADLIQKAGFMQKGMIFTTDLKYALQQVKIKNKAANVDMFDVLEFDIIDSAIKRTKAKKETYKNVVRFYSYTEVVDVV